MSEKHSEAWYATVAHYRAWLLADGGFVHDFENGRRTFDSVLIRRMARYYRVARTIPAVAPSDDESESSANADENQGIVARHLNLLVKNWPDQLNDRAIEVISTANAIRGEIKKRPVKNAKGENKRVISPYSAVSKFIWFAKPTGWTLYDRLASRGLLSGSSPGEQRVADFYRALGEEFWQLSEALRPACKNSGLPLWPERIIDVVLMIRGSEKDGGAFADDLRADCRTFLKVLPASLAEPLKALADDITKAFPPNALRVPVHSRGTRNGCSN